MIPTALRWLRLWRVPASWYVIALLTLTLGGQHVWWRGVASRERAERARVVQTLDELRGAVRGLTEAFGKLRPGEERIISVPWPYPVPGPLRTVPVTVTRTETHLVTRTEIQPIPQKEIERIIQTAPSSLTFDLIAKRDIKAGERFSVTAVQVAPGVWQAIVPEDSPVGGTVTARTKPLVDQRWTFRAYLGISTTAGAVAGAEAEYRFTPPEDRLQRFARASVECQRITEGGCPRLEGRVILGASW